MARPWSARCYGVARQREGSRQNSTGVPALTPFCHPYAREGADGQAVVCPLLRGSSPTRWVACEMTLERTIQEWLCRAADRIDPARVFGPHHCLGQGTSASASEKLCGLLQRRENASVIEQGCACLSLGSAIRRPKFARHTGRTSSSIRSDLDFRYTQLQSNPDALVIE